MTTNSDADVIHAISCCIGHISRQRVRFIQMELRKFATDSRIRNERHFWTLLENNGVRFSARTAHNFLSKIKDQRGINVETAMQYLKNSHRRTRRDSVEAMVTINMPKKGKKHQTDTAPELIQKNASRRMSLDEFRRVGRMVVNVASISGGSSKSKLSYLQGSVSSGRMSPKSLLEDTEQEESDDANNSIDSRNSNLFKILLEEPKSDVEEDDEDGKPPDDYSSPAKDLLSLPEPVNVPMPPIVIDQNEILQAARKKKKKKNGKSKKSKTQPPCHITITIEDVDKDKSESTLQPIFGGIPGESGGSKSVYVEGKPNPGCMNNFKSEEPAPPSNAEDLKNPNEEEQQENFSGRYIAKESFPLVKNSNKETEISTTEVREVPEETSEPAVKIEEGITSSFEAKNPNEEECAYEGAKVETEIKSGPKEGSILDDGDDGASAETEVPDNIESSTQIQSDEENPLAEKSEQTTEFVELNKNEDVESVPPQDKDEDRDMKQTEVVIEVQDNQDAKSTEGCYIVDKYSKREATEYDRVSNGSEKSESLAEVKEPSINQEDENESFSGTEESELHWLSTDEDEEDEKSEKEIDFDATSIADFGGEMVEVGGNYIEMFPPDWTQNKEYMSSAENTSNTSQPKLDLNWVYGCDVTNAQSIVSLNDEILYGSGCIVVLYNHARNSQRHYIGHSGPITCIAVHSDKTTVGSAQGESPTATKMLGAVSESLTQSSNQESYHGRIHVRVWKPEDLSTLFVMGVGSLQNNIRKMQFMNCRNYMLTIEEDEESSLTLWDKGCKIKRIFSAPKSFIESTDHSRASVSNKLSKAPKTSPKKVSTNVDNRTRGIDTSLTRGPEFVLAGKEHLGFWRIKDQDYSSSSAPKEDFVKIIGPIRGDFMKQFRPRYVTCCHSAERSGSGLFVSGDTNGTILVWSEELKEVIGSAKHAHECSVSCVLPTKSHIFSGGVTDRKIKAFSWGKEELECVGSIILPLSVGQVASLSLTGSNLFVGTTQNLIVTVELNHPGYSYHTRSTTNVKVERKTAFSLPNSPRNKNQESNAPPSLFSDWYPLEIARGFKGRTQCVCAVDFLKKRTRSRHLTPQPTNDTTGLKNAGLKKTDAIESRTDVRSVKSAFQAKRNNARGKENTKSVSSETLPRPVTAFSSPKLRTSERVLKREQARNDDTLHMSLPKFAEENFVNKRLFLSSFPKGNESPSAEITTKSEKSENEKSPFFATASSDGWVVICDATEHSVVGRLKMPSKRDITCIDCCSKRGVLALGSSSGHVTLIHIHIDGFETNNEQYFRGSCGGSREVEVIKFSKNGQKIAFSVSSDIVLAFVKSSGIQEIGRCSGHKSEKITSLDWSSVSLKNSELLRSSALAPEPELLVWWADTMKPVEDLSIVRNVKWKSNSCSLDYAIKGIWDYFKIPTELTCVTVSETRYGKKASSPDENRNSLSVGGFVSSFSNWSTSDDKESETPDSDITCCAGDVLGCVRAYHYPFVSQDAKESVSCVYHSAVADVTCFDGKLITTSKDDRNIIQFDIKARHGSNSI